MVSTSGLSNAPTTTILIVTHLCCTALSLSRELVLAPNPQLWRNIELARLLTYQAGSATPTDALSTCALLYHVRVLERLWGSRKFASWVAVALLWNGVCAPTLASALCLATRGWYDFLPAGMTGLVFAALVGWSDEVPRLSRSRILMAKLGERPENAGDAGGVVFSDKSPTYLLAAQLALSQFPRNLLPAAVGWIVGVAMMNGMLPGSRWRLPKWLVRGSPAGNENKNDGSEITSLRASEDGQNEGLSATASGSARQDGSSRSRPMGRQIMGNYRSVS